MPIFEYKCGACGHQFEKITSRAMADEVDCEKCESAKTERLLSVFGVASGSKSSDLPCGEGACKMPPMPGGMPSPCSAGACPAMMN